MKYLYETKLPMLIDADVVPISHQRPYRDIDIRYPWKSDEQRAAEDEVRSVNTVDAVLPYIFRRQIQPHT